MGVRTFGKDGFSRGVGLSLTSPTFPGAEWGAGYGSCVIPPTLPSFPKRNRPNPLWVVVTAGWHTGNGDVVVAEGRQRHAIGTGRASDV